MQETQRICADSRCNHPKRGHDLPRSEGGYGGGNSGRCVVFQCGCPQFVSSDEFVEQEYSGDPMPKWVTEGVKVKVKRLYRDFSIPTYGGDRGNDRAHPGEVGEIERVDGIGYWSWRIKFSGGRYVRMSEDLLNEIVRVRR